MGLKAGGQKPLRRTGRVRLVAYVVVAGLEAVALTHLASSVIGNAAIAILVGFVALVSAEALVRVRASARQTRTLQEANLRILREVTVALSTATDEAARAAAYTRDLSTQLQSGLEGLTADREQSAKGDRRAVRDAITGSLTKETQQVEALMQSYSRIAPRALMPPSGEWAMDPRSIAHLVDLVLKERPQLVVELGSGTSTIWLGYALETYGGRLISVDHEEDYAAKTRHQVSLHELESTIDLRVAPLAALDGTDGGPLWYDQSVFSGCPPIDLVLVDGPPKSSGPMSRKPTIEALHDYLSPQCTILLDDSDRPDETQTLADWLRDFPEFVRVDLGISRLAVIRRR